jgi:hypothetical protein
MFKDCISEKTVLETPTGSQPGTALVIDEDEDLRDPALKNLDGDGAQMAAMRWAENSKLVAKLQVIQMFVKGPELAFVQGVINRRNAQARLLAQGGAFARGLPADNGDEDDSQGSLNDREEDYAKTAHMLFADFSDAHRIVEEQNSWSLSSMSNRNQTLSPNTKRNGSSNQRTHVSDTLAYSTESSSRKQQKHLSASPKQRALTNIINRSDLLSPSINSPSTTISRIAVHANPTLPAHSAERSTVADVATIQNNSNPTSENGSAYPSSTVSLMIKRTGPTQSFELSLSSPQKRFKITKGEVNTGKSAADKVPDPALKRVLKARRLKIAERLCTARPDLVSPLFIAKQNRRQARKTSEKAFCNFLTGGYI